MLLFDMASGECGKWWRAQNNIENYETHNENFFMPKIRGNYQCQNSFPLLL